MPILFKPGLNAKPGKTANKEHKEQQKRIKEIREQAKTSQDPFIQFFDPSKHAEFQPITWSTQSWESLRED